MNQVSTERQRDATAEGMDEDNHWHFLGSQDTVSGTWNWRSAAL